MAISPCQTRLLGLRKIAQRIPLARTTTLPISRGIHTVSYTHLDVYKRQVVAYASRPWQGSSRGSSSPGDFYGSDTPEAIALCMNCTREDCTSSCWEIKEVLHRTRRKNAGRRKA